MSLVSRLLEWKWKLPPAETRDVAVERDVPVPMPDGVVLLADRHYPRGRERAPTILVRTPYGRKATWALMFGRPFAERGFQVLLQSCRGTFGSGGDFEPFRNEHGDGVATLLWLERQPWFSGDVATLGMSYLGFTQWALQAEAGPKLKAMAVQVSSSEFRSAMFAGGSFWLETALFWSYLVSVQERSLLLTMLANLRVPEVVQRAASQLPLRDAGAVVTDQPVPFLRLWMEHEEPGDPWWAAVDFSAKVAETSAPVQLIGGWYDIFLPQTLADYARLRAAGKQPQLLVGPWFHTDQRWIPVSLRESLAFFRAHLLGDKSGLREAPVRVFVMGADAWRDLPSWPPPHREERWHLQPDRGLSPASPVASEPDRYRYDPRDPTPTVGGSTLTTEAGAKDNRAVEARADVRVFTSAPLDREVLAMGPVRAELHVASSLAHTDFFVRLCDVHPSGASINVTDGIVRLSPGRGSSPGADGALRVEIDLWATAHCWKPGHRLRLQVSSGAHPRHARNPGSGEPLATATTLVTAEQIVHHDPARPSAIILPVVEDPT